MYLSSCMVKIIVLGVNNKKIQKKHGMANSVLVANQKLMKNRILRFKIEKNICTKTQVNKNMPNNHMIIQFMNSNANILATQVHKK